MVNESFEDLPVSGGFKEWGFSPSQFGRDVVKQVSTVDRRVVTVGLVVTLCVRTVGFNKRFTESCLERKVSVTLFINRSKKSMSSTRGP